MSEPKLYDAYGRPLTNLRISVTNECNYRCIFCHVEGHPVKAPLKPGSENHPLKPDDYWVIAKGASRVGVDSFKITGGEPLLRGDIIDIVSAVRDAAPTADISMTTNGYLLSDTASLLRDSGLNRVNISIHSLRRDRYKFITGVDGLEKALEGLRVSSDVGFDQIKINAVILRGVNDDEIWDLIDLARDYDAILQLIELHPVGLGRLTFKRYYKPLGDVEEKLRSMAAKIERRSLHNRPVYILTDGVKVEVVRPYANPLFCAGCKRVRLLPDGLLSPCLNWKGPFVNLLAYLRRASTLEEKIEAVINALIKVNSLRRPYFLWPLSPPEGVASVGSWSGRLRLRLPKRRPPILTYS